MDSDQKPFTGGSSPLSKCITYLLAPSYGLPSAAAIEVGYTASLGDSRLSQQL
jgi:hypothetical protein